MNTPSRILQSLDPPTRGWERLIRRRDADSSWLIPLAALTSAVAVVVFAFPWPHHPIELQLNGARLLGQRSQGMTLRMLDKRKVVVLPSGDPNVRLYWIERGSEGRAN